MQENFTSRTRMMAVTGGVSPQGFLLDLIIVATPLSKRFRLRFTGVVAFDEGLKRHVRRLVLPLIDKIAHSLGIPKRSFEVSAANPSEASAIDQAVAISGYSADAPIFCALLAAQCGLEIDRRVTSTGHIASYQGDIRAVANLDAKITAARREREISTILCPADQLDQTRAKRVYDSNDGCAKLIAIQNVADLVPPVFSNPIALICAALNGGWLRSLESSQATSSPIQEAARFLVGEENTRFPETLRLAIRNADNVAIKVLLDAYVDRHIRDAKYPKELVTLLDCALRSTPRATLRLKIHFPLISRKRLRQLNALQTQRSEVSKRLEAIAAGTEYHACTQKSPPQPPFQCDPLAPITEPNEAAHELDALLEELDEKRLTQETDLVIDSARASYFMDCILVKNSDEFVGEITAFFTHLTQSTADLNFEHANDSCSAQAIDLVTCAYAQQGGWNAALGDAISGKNGGLRAVFDAMTAAQKSRERKARVFWAIQKVIDPTDWGQRVAFFEEFIRRFPRALPAELRNKSAEQYARHYDEAIKSLMQNAAKTQRRAKAK